MEHGDALCCGYAGAEISPHTDCRFQFRGYDTEKRGAVFVLRGAGFGIVSIYDMATTKEMKVIIHRHKEV